MLEPSDGIHPDYVTLVLITSDGKTHTGLLRQRSANELQLLDAEGKLVQIRLDDIDEQRKIPTSLMPADLFKTITSNQFADLIAYLTTLKQKEGEAYPGLPAEIPHIAKPVILVPFHSDEMRFDHPVWIIAKPGTRDTFLVVEQQTRKIWQLVKNEQGDRRRRARLPALQTPGYVSVHG